MGLQLKIGIEENCDSLYVFENTGKYDKECNPNGWGTPNRKISDVVSAQFSIYLPKSEDPFVINVFPEFPSDDKYGYEILPIDFQSDVLMSGIWRFDYIIDFSDGEKIVTSCTQLLTMDVNCCISNTKINIDTNNFDSNEVRRSNDLYALFESAKANACLGKINESQKIIDFLYNKCNCNC